MNLTLSLVAIAERDCLPEKLSGLSALRQQVIDLAFADPLPQARAADQISGDLCVFPLGHVPGHDLVTPDIDH